MIRDHVGELNYLRHAPEMLDEAGAAAKRLARQSFGGTTCLVEHFRCVPEIIQFSNMISYDWRRSEEHTSELQSLRHLVCRLLLEKKKKKKKQQKIKLYNKSDKSYDNQISHS